MCVRVLLFGYCVCVRQDMSVYGTVRVCAWAARVCERNAIVSGSRLSRATVLPLQRKHCAFSFCAVIIRLIFSIGCCRLFVLARSGATPCTFRWRSEILESWKLNLKFARYFHVFAFATPLKMRALMQYPLFHRCFNVGVFGNAGWFIKILLSRTFKRLWM